MNALSDKYRTIEKLGQGGMGEVFRGQMTGVEGFTRAVAIKMLHDLYTDYEPARTLFAHEARVCGTLSHRNVVSVLDFAQSDAGALFLVMEYVDADESTSRPVSQSRLTRSRSTPRDAPILRTP